jgi:poly-gamma-glutamate capsule biosynthesis protein CapA/YwtB (metallophosphatase superfamily)
VVSVRILLGAALALSLAGCTDEADPKSAPPSESSESPSVGQPNIVVPVAPPPMALVGHATRPQLDIDKRTWRRLVSGKLDQVGGRRVVAGIRAVERDPDAIAVVPLDRVGPTVVAARVAGVDPVRSHPDAITVTVTGDIMLVRGVPDGAASLRPMSRRLAGADLTVGNLEMTLSTNGEPTIQDPVTDSFGGSPAALRPLVDAGFDALSLGNNHTGDYGPVALVETVRAMAKSPIESFGAGATLAEASRPAVLDVDGTRFAFVGFNAIGETPQALPGEVGALSVRMPPRTGSEINQADVEHVTGVIRRASRRADVVVVLPHWGEQYTHTPWPEQRTVSRRLVEAGADLVVGGHPHWVQGMDDVDGVPVIHSLGNFVFDMNSSAPEVREGVVMETTWWGQELKAFRLVPYRMELGEYVPRVIDGADILADVWDSSTGPYSG